MNTAQALSIIVTAIFAGGGATAFFRLRQDRESLVGATAKALAEAATELVEPLRKENGLLRDRVTLLEERVGRMRELQLENTICKARVAQLEQVIRGANIQLPPSLEF